MCLCLVGVIGLFVKYVFVFEEGDNGVQVVVLFQIGEGLWVIVVYMLGIVCYYFQ